MTQSLCCVLNTRVRSLPSSVKPPYNIVDKCTHRFMLEERFIMLSSNVEFISSWWRASFSFILLIYIVIESTSPSSSPILQPISKSLQFFPLQISSRCRMDVECEVHDAQMQEHRCSIPSLTYASLHNHTGDVISLSERLTPQSDQFYAESTNFI